MDLPQIFRASSSLEAQAFLQSLPSCHAWGRDLCLYKGSWHAERILSATLISEKNFQATDSDIIVAGIPKSGNTWLKSLVFAITRRAQYPISDPDHPLRAANPHELVPLLDFFYTESDDPDLSQLPSPRLFGTHNSHDILPESVKATRSRVVYICREPKDTLVSSWYFFNKIGVAMEGAEDYKTNSLEEAFELFCEGICLQGPIWDHVLGYWNASLEDPEKVLFLKYDDLKGDTTSQVKKIAEFLSFPFSAEEESEGVAEEIARMCGFESLSNLEVNKSGGKRYLAFAENTIFFRKGETGDWANHLTPAMAEKLDQITEEKLKGTGFNFH